MSKGPPRQDKKEEQRRERQTPARLPAENHRHDPPASVQAGNVPAKMPITPRDPEDRKAPGKNGGTPKTRAAPGRIACPAIPNTITNKE